MVRKIQTIIIIAFFFSVTLLAQETEKTSEAPVEKKWYDLVNVSGYVDVYYNYTTNNKQGGAADTSGTFNTYNKQFAVNAVKLAFEKVADKESPWGFRMDWQNGQNLMYQERPYQTTNSLQNMQLLQQGYVSMYFNVGNGLIVDVGKMATHIGNELLDSMDNMNYTIGYIFFNTIPFIQTGARATLTLNDKWSTGLYFYNSGMGTGYTGGAGNIGQQFGATGVTPYGDSTLTTATPSASYTNTTQHSYVDGPNHNKAFGTQVKGEINDKFSIVWNTLYADDNLKARQSDMAYSTQNLVTNYTLPNQPSQFRVDNWFVNHMSFVITPMEKLTVLLDWTFGQRRGETANTAFGYYNPDLSIDLNRDGTKDHWIRGDKRDTVKIYNTYGLWMKYDFTEKWAAAVRYEYIDDSRYGGALVVNPPLFGVTPTDRYDLLLKDQVGLRAASSKGQVRTFTITPTYNFSDNLQIKVDLRRDWGLGKQFIDQQGRAAHAQHGIIVGMVAKF
ncbi:MAG: porin [Leptospiraceae bacterium]|nr:porin [Leptospiraceae bacterium]MCP5513313.1 porin [Leptospiraceae bacterium]